MPQVTCCLKDRSLVVRRNTLILLIRLLQEDYLKLKGTFFFRLIQCLMDPEVGRQPSSAFVFSCLSSLVPGICLYVL